jgi:hypothetical protein
MLPLEHRGALGMPHLPHHAVAVLDIEVPSFERKEHDLRVETVNHEVGRISDQAVIISGIHARGGGAGLTNGESNQPGIGVDCFGSEYFFQRQGLGV